MNYDALLIVSFGGPEGMEDVLPFLENVLRGKNVPRERMLQVARHYQLFGGVSPINGQNRKLIASLEEKLRSEGPHLPIYLGNRNWHPLLADTLVRMRDDGVRNALAFVTSAYSSYSSCRQYLENIAGARQTVGEDAPRVDKIRAFYNHPLFIEANVEQIRAALATFSEPDGRNTRLVFTAHSIPLSMAQNCEYESQLNETARLVSEALGFDQWRLVFQSRSGPPTQPWLGPDICDYLREVKNQGVNKVVIAPIGFVSDHMEVIYDLDMMARETCEQLGITMRRAATAGTHSLFIDMIRELILERTQPGVTARFAGKMAPNDERCFTDCCLQNK
ncbi:MAG TPA: ferrochelatase [Pyrinomonadaceae bacterium]|nr:ferrochelatase [Pyrinomonadaceae bacterium]